MTMPTATSPEYQPQPPHPVGSATEAEQLVGHLSEAMDALLGVVEEETTLVRAGRLYDAARLEPRKAELSRTYLADATRIKASLPYLSQALPQVAAVLRQRHDTFHAVLQINLTVLATAHAVSEGIIRGVSTELARRASPQTYGASGQATAPKLSGSPLMLARML